MLANKTSLLGWVYRNIIKPGFFLCDPEWIHNSHIKAGRWMGQFWLTRQLLKLIFFIPATPITIANVKFPGRVGLAAGFDYNGDLTQILPELGFGWHTIGTVTWNPYPGNPKPRLGRFPNSQALLVNKGLKSIGTKNVIHKLQTTKLGQFRIPTVISIASTNQAYNSTQDQLIDILASFIAFERSGLDHAMYEMNISCPNTFGGEPFTSPDRLELLLSCLDKLNLSKPLLVKMPIDQSESDTLLMLKVLAEHQVTGLIFGNLTKDKNNPAVDALDAKQWKHRKGNLSGKPTWSRSNALLKLTKQHYQDRFVLIGTGGVFSGSDAQHKLDLGADLVQLITGMIYQGPQLVGEINYNLG